MYVGCAPALQCCLVAMLHGCNAAWFRVNAIGAGNPARPEAKDVRGSEGENRAREERTEQEMRAPNQSARVRILTPLTPPTCVCSLCDTISRYQCPTCRKPVAEHARGVAKFRKSGVLRGSEARACGMTYVGEDLAHLQQLIAEAKEASAPRASRRGGGGGGRSRGGFAP